MTRGSVLCSIEGRLCTLTLNRPDKLNALTVEAFRELDSHLSRILAEPDIGCVVLRGAGRSFCAGHDLGGIAGGGEDGDAKHFESGVVERLAELPMPVVASIHGHCLTGGLELALAADLIVAAESARFSDTHSRWDLVPVWGGSQRLPRRVGRAKALEMMFTGRSYSGRDAEAMGLANICVPDADLPAATDRLTGDILANADRANRAIKRLLDDTEGMTVRAGVAWELHRTAGRGPELQERLARFRKGSSRTSFRG